MTLHPLDRYIESAAGCECCDCTCAGDVECGVCADCGCHHHDIRPLVAEIRRLRAVVEGLLSGGYYANVKAERDEARAEAEKYARLAADLSHEVAEARAELRGES